MKIWFLKYTIKNYLFWAFLLLPIFMYIVHYFFKDKETVLAAISTGLVAIFGYFATHYLTISRNQQEKKFQLYLELIKKIRFFILETSVKGSEEQRKMRDDLQDALFAFSLLTSEKSYKSLSKMMEKFNIFNNCSENNDENLTIKKTALNEFKKAQSHFVNNLRKEFFIDREIDFETYDIRLEQDKPKN